MGSFNCIFWFGTGVARAPWNFEVACYGADRTNCFIQVGTLEMPTTVGSINTADGSFTYEIIKLGTGFSYTIDAQATADTTPTQVTGTF